MKKIDSTDQFDQLVENEASFFLLKHSTTCPISQAGYNEFDKFAQNNENCYVLIVQDSRDVSNYIAEKFHVKHESPQAILFVNSNVAWHASHFKITAKGLETAKLENIQ